MGVGEAHKYKPVKPLQRACSIMQSWDAGTLAEHLVPHNKRLACLCLLSCQNLGRLSQIAHLGAAIRFFTQWRVKLTALPKTECAL